MSRFLTTLLLVALTAFLHACGGGGGGGEGGRDPNDGGSGEQPAVANYVPQVPKPTLTKVHQRTPILHEEALNWLETLHAMSTVLYAVGDIDGSGVAPAFLEDNAKGDISEANCEQGRLLVDDYGSTVVGTFKDCLEDGVTLNGQLVATANPSTPGREGRLDIRYRYLQMTSAEGELVAHGDLVVDESGVTATDLYYHNVPLNRTFYTDDMNLYYGNVNGRIYADQLGYVIVQSSFNGESIQLNGVGVNKQSAWIKKDSGEKFFDAELIDQEGTLYQTDITLEALLNRAYRPNRAPVLDDSQAWVSVEGESLEITVPATDPDADYLVYQWQYDQGPADCATPELTGGGNTVTFKAQCRGEHQLVLTIDDGRDDHRYQIPYQVIAPAPEISQDLGEIRVTERGIQAQVDVLSPDEHGPFTYYIESPDSGATINENGLISIESPERAFQSHGGEITVFGSVSNETSTPFALAVPMRREGESPFIVYPGRFRLDQPWGDWNRDGQPDQLIDFGESFALVEMTDTGLKVVHTETRELSDGRLRHYATQDTNADGELEIVLAYERELVVLSGRNFEVLMRRRWQDQQQNPAQIPNSTDAVLVSDDEPLILYEAYQPGIGIAPMSYRFDEDRHTPIEEDVYREAVKRQSYTYADLDGEGVQSRVEVQAIEDSDHRFEVRQYDPADTEAVIKTLMLELPSDLRWDAEDIQFMNMDSEPGDELVATNWTKAFQVYKAEDQSFAQASVIEFESEHNWMVDRYRLYPFDGQSGVIRKGTALVRLSIENGVEEIPLNRVSFGYSNHGYLGYHLLEHDNADRYTLVTEQTAPSDQAGMARLVLDNKLEIVEQQLFDQRPPFVPEGVASISSASSDRQYAVYFDTSSGDVVIWDPETGANIPSDSENFAHFHSGDLDGDGLLEVYGQSSIEVIQLDPTTYQSRRVEGAELESTVARLLIMDSIDTPQLLLSTRDDNTEHRIRIYRQKEGRLSLHADHRLDIDVTVPQIRQQDVNGDGIPEVILSADRYGDRQAFWVFDINLNPLTEFEIDGLEYPKVFNIPSARSERLFVFDQGRVMTINPKKKRIEDQSQRFEGSVNAFSLLCHGNDIMTCPKTLMTSEGIYQYTP